MASRERRLTIDQRDALDAQDKRLELGRYELVLCSDGKMRPKWLRAAIARDHAAKEALNTHALHQGRWIRS